MRNSIFPALAVVCILVVIFAHLGATSRPDPGVSRWVNTDRTLPDEAVVSFAFKKVTDTVLTNGFHMTSEVTETRTPGYLVKKRGITPLYKTAIYDTLIACRFGNRVLFKDLSLKALAMKDGDDLTFWNLAGLESFAVDPIHSTSTSLHCNFSFVNALNKERRNFVLITDRKGKTRIKEV